MSVCLYPSGAERPEPLPGVVWYGANPDEMLAASMNKGDMCWFRYSKGEGFGRDLPLSDWIPGVLRYTYFYDGVVACVYEQDPDDLIEHSLFLDMGDRIAPWGPRPS